MHLPPTFSPNTTNINAIIETPKRSSIKYTYNPETQLFEVSKILPEGLSFPLHFGFIPGTKGEDGDPLDVMVLMDEPTYPGVHVPCKLVGVIEALQTEEGKTFRNDRLIAAALASHRYQNVNQLKDIEKILVDEIIAFFVTYNQMNNKKFKVIRRMGPSSALKLIKKQIAGKE